MTPLWCVFVTSHIIHAGAPFVKYGKDIRKYRRILYLIVVLYIRLNLVQIFADFLDVELPQLTQCVRLSHNVSDFHQIAGTRIVFCKGNRHVVVAVQFLYNDARTDGVPLQTDHEIADGRAVACLNDAGIIVSAEHLLRKVKRAVPALLKREARVVRQIGKMHTFKTGKRVFLADVDVGADINQFVKYQIAGAQKLTDGSTVEIAQIQDADFTAQGGNIVNDVFGFGFPDCKFVLQGIKLFDRFNECLDGKGGGDGGHLHGGDGREGGE